MVAIPVYSDLRYALPAFPRQVRMELSSFCNAGCTFCHAHGEKKLTRKKAKMETSLAEHLIEDIASWSMPLYELVPTNFGELFIHKDWHRILLRASELLPRTRLTIVTTGTLMTPGALEKLASVPTVAYVNFSINAYYAETWERIHKMNRKFMEIAVNAVHAFRDRRPDVEVNVSMVYDSALVTEKEKDMFLVHWNQFGNVTFSPASYARNPLRKPENLVTLPCRSVFDGLVVFTDGKVGPACCFDGDADPELNIGHFPEERLIDIWKGERLAKLCEIHNRGLRGSVGICSECTFA